MLQLISHLVLVFQSESQVLSHSWVNLDKIKLWLEHRPLASKEYSSLVPFLQQLNFTPTEHIQDFSIIQT